MGDSNSVHLRLNSSSFHVNLLLILSSLSIYMLSKARILGYVWYYLLHLSHKFYVPFLSLFSILPAFALVVMAITSTEQSHMPVTDSNPTLLMIIPFSDKEIKKLSSPVTFPNVIWVNGKTRIGNQAADYSEHSYLNGLSSCCRPHYVFLALQKPFHWFLIQSHYSSLKFYLSCYSLLESSS